MRNYLKIAAIVGAVALATARTGAATDTTRHFYWEGVFGFEDCYWPCDYTSPASGCLTDPDCKCTCFQ
jgi:hypothetical protein